MIKVINPPRPMRMVWGFAGAFWLAGFYNPGFFVVAGICLMYIPVLMIDQFIITLNVMEIHNQIDELKSEPPESNEDSV